MSIYMTNPDALPDDAFDAGAFHHLVVGNEGRLLDPRRTPISIVALRHESGVFVVRIEDFEDRGALWEMPFEDVNRFQFDERAERAMPNVVAEMREVSTRFDQPLSIACDAKKRESTLMRINQEQADADAWLTQHSTFLASGRQLPGAELREGDELLFDDLERFMVSRSLRDVEESFSQQYVRAPHSGEIVRGHRIVLAELGLVPYEGKVPRDASVFEGTWARDCRADHIVARLGFVRALFKRMGMHEVIVYRGMSICGPFKPSRNQTFVSASFSRRVAESHFEAGGPTATRLLMAKPLAVERLFMTFYETAPMNRMFCEGEAVILWSEDDPLL